MHTGKSIVWGLTHKRQTGRRSWAKREVQLGHVKTSLFLFLVVFRGISLGRRFLGSYAVRGEIPLYFYVPVFPWKDFLMGWIRKIPKHKEERDR
jgi:hypothetical protein